MSGVIAWTCTKCGHHEDGLSVEQYLATEHVCRVADEIRCAIPYWRSQGRDAVAEWLESCASNADHMADPDDFGICDEPGSVQHALHVARSTPRTEES